MICLNGVSELPHLKFTSDSLVERILQILADDPHTASSSEAERVKFARSLSASQLFGFTVDDITDADLRTFLDWQIDSELTSGRLRPVPTVEAVTAHLSRSAPNEDVRNRIRSLVANMTEDERLYYCPTRKEYPA